MYGTRKRIYIDVSEDEYDIIQKSFPQGTRQTFFHTIIQDLIPILKDPEKRSRIISSVVTRQVRLWDLHKLGEDKE